MTYSLGIDLGTTYTAAALARRGRAEVVTLGYRATSIPTVVALTDDGTFLVGDPAERRGASQPERLAREFKRRVGDPTPMLIGGTPFSVDRLLAEVLRFVLATVTQTEGGPPASTVVTHPANWGPFKRDVLDQALRLAGVEGATLLPEPAAAATWYGTTERVAPGTTVAVYDLGGGTFDAAVLEMGPDGAFALRGRPEGVERLGGIDVDAAVVDHALRAFGPAAATLDPEGPGTMMSLARLRHDCVEAKEALSTETAVTIHAALPVGRADVLLRRGELEELITPLFAPTIDALRRAVASAGLGTGHPHAVLLVGGSSRMPFIAREVSIALGRPVAVDAHPKHPVALGAALVAAERAPSLSPAATTAPGLAPPAAPPAAAAALADGPAGPGPMGPPSGGYPVPQPAPPAGPAPVDRPAAFTAGGASLDAPPVPQPAPGPGQHTWPSGPYATPPSGPWPQPPGLPPPGGDRPTGRRNLVIVGVLAVLALVAGALVLQAGGDDGPGAEAAGGRGLQGGADGQDAGTGEGDEGDGQPAAGPQMAWDYDVGEETIGTPAVDALRAYVADSTGHVTALNLTDGTVAWHVSVGTEATGSSPVVAGDVVIASATDPYHVQALDAATGAVRWTTPDVWASEPPVVVDDTVFVSMGYRVAALGLADGVIRWDVEFEDALDLWTNQLLAGGLLVGGSSEGKVFAMDPATGEIRWVTAVPRGEVTIWSIAVVGDRVLAFDDDYYVSGMSVASGDGLWAVDAHATHPGSIAALGADAAVLVDPGELLRLDPATGAERGRFPGGSLAMLDLPGETPLLAVAGVDALRVYGADGAEVWSSSVPFQALDMAAGPSTLVITDYEGKVAAYPLT
jgi:molecular chaperone DnaK